MQQGEIITLVQTTLTTLLYIIAPILGVSVVVGLVVSILQATTSIQEQTLTFVPKVVALFLTLFFLGSWMLTHLSQFTIAMFTSLPGLAR